MDVRRACVQGLRVLGIAAMFVTQSLAQVSRNALPPKPLLPIPTERHMAWHDMERNAFVHFTVNTFTGKEWGNGDESPTQFDPTKLVADQWARVFREAGFKGVILTCKHHDGFCLWPSEFTDHSVAQSPFREGRGDVVREVADACRRAGLKFGIYLSPWDRNHAAYGTPKYITYYRDQLKELCANYGPVFEMWFDGANGGSGYYGGSRETRRIDGAVYYDWPTTLTVVRSLQPEIVFFSDAGPDVRWCGNEQAIAGETNWCTFNTDTIYAGKSGIEALLNAGVEDGTKWVPAEANTSIRPGWFYHAEEDSLVKTPGELFEVYLNSVGRGSTLLLNVPPDRSGRISEHDVQALLGWQKLIEREFRVDLARGMPASSSSYRASSALYAPENVTDGNAESYWTTDDSVTTGSIEIIFAQPLAVKYIVVKEYIRLGQRIRSFTVEASMDGRWIPVGAGTTVGYKRILKVDMVAADRIRVNIGDAKACPIVSEIELY